MSEQDREFEIWYESRFGKEGLKTALNHTYLQDGEYVYESTKDKLLVWQAATAEANKRIESLEVEVAELKGEKVRHDQLVDYLKAGIAEELEQTILELQANNNDLREALEVVFNNIELFKSMWMLVPPFGDKVNKATRQAISEATSPIFIAFNETQKALSATPAESLQAHERKEKYESQVIAECTDPNS